LNIQKSLYTNYDELFNEGDMKPNSTFNSLESEKSDSLALQAELCHVLTHPLRLKIINILKDGEKNVSTLKELTNERQPFISQHLRVLRERGVVTTRRKKNEVYYSLSDPKILEICEIVADLIEKRSETPKTD
jgi:ArsR family transcriptional regulator